ncbi:MAG: exodeoxyribonuclease VII small subunit [Candidatus Latescibacterota bacterium]|nr:MAG: exodeoxyribonuclease VII small subunit [Candidatus Latescibacterota bacterium]
MGKAKADEKLDFEASMQKLDRIVQELETPQVPLERAIELFEEGLKLGEECSTLLEKAQARVEKLLERADGSAEARPMDPS